MPIECAFCPEPATTREHFWGDWLNDRFGRGTQFRIARDVNSDVKQWPSTGLHVRKLVLCEDCNNVWGSDLEGKVGRILGDATHLDTHLKLDASDIATLVIYTMMKAMVLDYSQREEIDSFYSRSDRFAFRKDFTFPNAFDTWLAHSTLEHGVFKAVYRKSRLNTPNRFEMFIFTISIGKFVVQINSYRWVKKAWRRHRPPPKLPRTLRWINFAIPVWPKCDFPVNWPPSAQLEGDLLNEFVDRW